MPLGDDLVVPHVALEAHDPQVALERLQAMGIPFAQVSLLSKRGFFALRASDPPKD